MDPVILIRALIGAAIGGAIGAAAWFAISVTTGYELGILAWGVGLVAGFGAFVAVRGAGSTIGTGIIASVVALAAVLGGKWAAATHHANEMQRDISTISAADTWLIVDIADEIVTSREAAGMTIEWPTEARIDTATEEHEYPADIWHEASDRWDSLPEPERQRLRHEAQGALAEFATDVGSTLTATIFRNSFGILDIVFVGLAMFTAFRLGAAGSDD